jgi:hypothetical protein
MEKPEATQTPTDAAGWTEHLARAAEAFAREMRERVPDEFTKHARGSLKEGLLAMRSLLDAGIERIEREEREKTARHVPVE